MNNRALKSVNNIICISIDKLYEEGCEIIMFNRYDKKGENFNHLDQILLPIEEFLDILQSPRSTTKIRSFKKNAEKIINKKINIEKFEWDENEFKNIKGKVATFYIYIKYRQNTTWQGEIFWKEKDKSANFLSELELLKILDSALGNLKYNNK